MAFLTNIFFPKNRLPLYQYDNRQWSCGFELGSATDQMEAYTANSPTVQGTTKRSGDYALQITSLVSTTPKRVTSLDLGALIESYSRAYVRFDTFPSAENRIMAIEGTIFTDLVWITVDNTGTIKLYDEDGQVTGTTSVSTNTWYRIEMHLIRTGSGAGTDTVEARVDGTSFASSTSRNIGGNFRYFKVGGNLAGEAQTTGNWFFDDLAVNKYSWPGAGSIVHLRPSAAGDNTNWTVTPPATSNYDDVNETTPNDATDYVSSLSAGTIDDYNIDDTSSDITSSSTVNVVHVGFRVRCAVAAGTRPRVRVRLKSEASGTVSNGTTTTINTTTWATNGDGSLGNYTLTSYYTPGNLGTPWTKTTLDSAQIGIEEVNTATNLADVSTIWMLIDYTTPVAITDKIRDVISSFGVIAFKR